MLSSKGTPQSSSPSRISSSSSGSSFDLRYALILALEKVFCGHKNYKFKAPKEEAKQHSHSTDIEEPEHMGGEEHQSDSARTEPHVHIPFEAGSKNWMTPILLLIALSVHSLFEGLALGVSDTKESIVGLLFGIAIHKWAASFSIVRILLT